MTDGDALLCEGHPTGDAKKSRAITEGSPRRGRRVRGVPVKSVGVERVGSNEKERRESDLKKFL